MKRRRATKATERNAVQSRLYVRNGRFYLDLRDLGLKREALIPDGQSYATTDQDVALDLAAQRLRAVLGQRDRHFTGLTRTASQGEFAREWLAHKRKLAGGAHSGENGEGAQGDSDGYTSLRTLHRYEQALEQLFTVSDQDLRMDEVKLRDVKRALAALRGLRSRSGGTLKASSIRQVIAAMQQVFDHASDEGVVQEGYNPWRALRRTDRPKPSKGFSTDFLEVYEGHALLEASAEVVGRSIPLRPIIATYLLTGGRREEVLGLECGDVDFRRLTVRFRTNRWRRIKTGEERTVPLWPQLERELRDYLARHPRTDGLLFPGIHPRSGAEQMITSLHKPMRAATAKAVLRLGQVHGAALARKEVTPRSLRPTYCAARLQTLDRGQPIAQWTVRGEMGHSSMAMINHVYGRLGTVRHRSEDVEFVPISED